MLGIKQNTTPLKGETAHAVRQAAMRVALRQPDKNDLEAMKRLKDARSKFIVIWK